MTDAADIWLRVLMGGQDEANQLPDIVRWINDHEDHKIFVSTDDGRKLFR